MRASKLSPIAAVAAALALPAAAGDSAWYVGAAAGPDKAASSLVRDREATIGSGLEPNLTSSADLRDAVGKLFAGYRLTSVFSVEAHWSDLGEQTIDTAFDVPFGQTGRGGVLTARKVDGYGIDVLAGMEPASRLRLYGKVGAFRAKGSADTTISGDTSFADGEPGTFRRRSASETIVKYGVGAEYAITNSVSGRFEWERFPRLGTRLEPGRSNATGEATHDAYWLGLILRF